MNSNRRLLIQLAAAAAGITVVSVLGTCNVNANSAEPHTLIDMNREIGTLFSEVPEPDYSGETDPNADNGQNTPVGSDIVDGEAVVTPVEDIYVAAGSTGQPDGEGTADTLGGGEDTIFAEHEDDAAGEKNEDLSDPDGAEENSGEEPGEDSGEENGESTGEDIGEDSEIESVEVPPEVYTAERTGYPEDAFIGMTREEMATYRNTEEYIKSLLVTSPEHYNEDIVNRAKAIPTESNDARYEYITGQGYKAYRTNNMPKGFTSDSKTSEQMVTFDVPVWKMSSDRKTRYPATWSITIHEKLQDSVRCIFSDIYQLDIQFPFNYLKGYMYRKVGGVGLMDSTLMSAHAFGVAIDINYWDDDNDYFLGKGNDLRNKSNPYCIPDEVIDIFAEYGWYWGGNFEICADTMHFQYFGLEFLQYETDEPFPILYRGAENMNSSVIRNLAQRLVKLGYLEKETGSFSRKVDTAVKAFQEAEGLEADGIVDYEVWERIINLTHDMSYVF